jgi:hypothetical protein
VALAAAGCCLWPAAPAAIDSQSDLDAFMSRVLERRNETWRVLHDYVLSERESFELVGPMDRRLFGTRREYVWFVRDGTLVRSPHQYDGVTIGEAERRRYEDNWVRQEAAREKRLAEKRAKADAERGAEGAAVAVPADDPASLVKKGLEPRFVSEAYFLKFRFEPGNYAIAGRETLEGRPVVRVEYYPTHLFDDKDEQEGGRKRDRQAETEPAASTSSPASTGSGSGSRASAGNSAAAGTGPAPKPASREEQFERDIERKMNKVALVTLWIDPKVEQIVKYTFENLGMDFLPGQWLVRVNDLSASMVMGQYFGSVWLPKTIDVRAGVLFASGTFDAAYTREFFDYRLGEVKARIRSYEFK